MVCQRRPCVYASVGIHYPCQRVSSPAKEWNQYQSRLNIMYCLYERFAKELTAAVDAKMQLCIARALGVPNTTNAWACSFNDFAHAIVTDHEKMDFVRLEINAKDGNFEFSTGRITRIWWSRRRRRWWTMVTPRRRSAARQAR